MASVVSPGCSPSVCPLALGLIFSQRGRAGSDQTSLPRRHQRRTRLTYSSFPAQREGNASRVHEKGLVKIS